MSIILSMFYVGLIYLFIIWLLIKWNNEDVPIPKREGRNR